MNGLTHKVSYKNGMVGITATALFAILFASAAGAAGSATVTATVTVQNVSLTVSDGTVTWGTLVADSTADTNSNADTQTITNNGNVDEDFDIRGTDSTAWAIAGTAGADAYVQSYCTATCDSAPTNYTALTTTNQTVATSVAAGATQDFDLFINTPTTSSSYAEQDVSVTIVASAS